MGESGLSPTPPMVGGEAGARSGSGAPSRLAAPPAVRCRRNPRAEGHTDPVGESGGAGEAGRGGRSGHPSMPAHRRTQPITRGRSWGRPPPGNRGVDWPRTCTGTGERVARTNTCQSHSGASRVDGAGPVRRRRRRGTFLVRHRRTAPGDGRRPGKESPSSHRRAWSHIAPAPSPGQPVAGTIPMDRLVPSVAGKPPGPHLISRPLIDRTWPEHHVMRDKLEGVHEETGHSLCP